MSVIKRNGQKEIISFDKILKRVKNLGKDELRINYTTLAMKIIDRLYHEIKTTEIDELTAQQCASLATEHPDYDILASRVLISNHQKSTPAAFTKVVANLYNYRDIHDKHTPLISKEMYEIVCNNSDMIESFFDYERDFLIDYFGFKTLERAYLMKINKVIVERPQHMWMRVAIGIHGSNLEKVKITYDLMSKKYFTHATPTLFNAGTPRPQCSSCYLIAMAEDSIEGIYGTLMDCAKISKWAGGIGLHIHNIRGRGSHIRGTNGNSNGIVPMLRVYNNTARYVDQGGGRRHGSFAVYLEPWHTDIEDFLEMKKNHGDEEARARDLFYALWIPDLFMKRVESDTDWTLMCPDHCPGLADCYGDDFEQLYKKYESEGKGVKKISARTLWFKILDSQIETGTPYMLYKDACNKKSNQKNLGTIKSSNLCTEIIEYSNKDETAVCNLASLGLPMFVRDDKTFDYDKLHEVTKIVTENLDKVIDVNFYPTPKTRRSNYLHRPIGIGVQGLADVFAKMDIAFYSDEAKQINIKIFETLYHAAVEKSCELSQQRTEAIKYLVTTYEKLWRFLDNDPSCRQYITEEGLRDKEGYEITMEHLNKYHPIRNEILQCRDKFPTFPNCAGAYSSFAGSPASHGFLQFDLWNVQPNSRYNWDELKQKIKQHGMRNSLLMAPMPTASTSQILGNNECFEPFTSNIYTRRTLAGEFIRINKYLISELATLGLWNEDVKNSIIEHKGSIQQLDIIPENIRQKFKIVWEIPMKFIIEMARDRGAFICQSQSLNLWMKDPNYKSLTAMHFFSWKQGLKTGLYYLRSRAKASPQQFTIVPKNNKIEEDNEPPQCEMCSG
jgi:ribonucleoside-diphosphate reductase alpha subunit